MKNVTITLPEDTARWLRIKAAEDDLSVSRWIAELLERMRRQQDDYEVAMQRYLAMKPREIEWPEGRRPTREELHDLQHGQVFDRLRVVDPFAAADSSPQQVLERLG